MKYRIMHNVGKARYLVSFHDGVKTHPDGSEFFDIRIFSNKKDLAKFERELLAADEKSLTSTWHCQ